KFGDDAFEAELAGGLENLVAVGFESLDEHQGFARAIQQPFKQPLAFEIVYRAQVVAIEVKQVEGMIADAWAFALAEFTAQLLEIRNAVGPVNHRFAVDDDAAGFQLARRGRN